MIGSFIKSTKDFINNAMKYAPLFIGLTLLVFGLITNNLAYLMSFAGMFVIIPIIVYVLYFIFDVLIAKKYPAMRLFDEAASGNAYAFIIPSQTDGQAVAPFMWYTMIMFFMGYLIINAKALYDYEVKNISQTKEDTRKIRSLIGMIASSIVLVCLLSFRSSYMAVPETAVGLVVLGIAAVAFALGWFDFLSSCSSPAKNVHLDDLYGIKTNILTPSPRKVCVARETSD
jgi:hypothetical protein